MDTHLFIHSLVSKCLGCFHFFAVTNNAAMNVRVQDCVWIYTFASRGCILRSVAASHEAL